MPTSKERVNVPPSFGIETFYVAQKFTLWCLQNTIKNFNFVISSAIWMKFGMSIEVNFESSNPFRSCKTVQWFSRYSILYSTCCAKINLKRSHSTLGQHWTCLHLVLHFCGLFFFHSFLLILIATGILS